MKRQAGLLCLILAASLTSGCQLMVLDDPAKLASLVPEAAEIMAPPPPPPPAPPPDPLPGSELISFMDPLTAQLNGCRQITSLTLTHNGLFEEGLVILRNRSLALSANMMVPVRLVEAQPEKGLDAHYYHVRMVRCPAGLRTAAAPKGGA